MRKRAGATTKPGTHGTLYLYEIIYTDPSEPGMGRMSTRMWAYNLEHVEQKFYDSGDGWEIISIARVPEGGGSTHRSTHHRPKRASEAHHSWEVIATDGGQTEILSRHKSRRAADRAARDTHMPGHRIEVVPSGTVPRVAEATRRSWWHVTYRGIHQDERGIWSEVGVWVQASTPEEAWAAAKTEIKRDPGWSELQRLRISREDLPPPHLREVLPSGTVPRVGEARKRSRYEALGSRSREAESVEKSASELEYAIGDVPGAVAEARRKLRGSWSRDAKDVIIPVFNELKRAVEHGRIVQNTSARSLLQLPVYRDQTHPFTEARNIALSHEALLKEAERLKSALSRATVGDADQVRAALDAVEGVGEPSGTVPRVGEARRGARKTNWAIGETVYTISRIPGHPVDIPTGAKVTIEEIQKPRSKRHKDSFGKWQTTRYEERIRVSYHGHDYWVDASDLAHYVSF